MIVKVVRLRSSGARQSASSIEEARARVKECSDYLEAMISDLFHQASDQVILNAQENLRCAKALCCAWSREYDVDLKADDLVLEIYEE